MESIWITGKRFFFFFEINFLRLIHPEIILKEFNLTTCEETMKQPLKQEGTKTIHTSEDRQNQGTIPNADICDKAMDYEFYNAGGITAELHGRTAKTANTGIAIRQIP